MSIDSNIEIVLENVNKISKKKDNFVKIVAVTKNHTIEEMKIAIDKGLLAVGENRIQETMIKYNVISKYNKNVEWHLIGHLQTNKVSQAVSMFDLIHSVDSERLAVEINKKAGKINKVQEILLQVNIANDNNKFGIDISEVYDVIQEIEKFKNLKLCGLMTIAPYFNNNEDVRPYFKKMYNLFNDLKTKMLYNTSFKWLSMGMTNDYSIAIEEGANIVRIGTAIFGTRDYTGGKK